MNQPTRVIGSHVIALVTATIAAFVTPSPAADAPPAAARLAIPAPTFDVKDAAEFAKCVDTTAKLEKLAGGLKFIEGPVWVQGDGDGYLVFSDIPADELKKWTSAGGLAIFRQPSNMVNGNTLDGEGRLISACHGKRCVLRADKDGKVETLIEKYDGKKLNSPNDVAVKTDGTIWFTDPPYGIKKGEEELDFHGVYRLDPKTKQLTLVAKDKQFPNGIAFSPDEKVLYVARSDGKGPIIQAYEVKADGTLGEGREHCRIDKGIPDGIRVDADGRIWSSAGDGVQVFSKEGKLIGKVLVPEAPANLCFGGRDGQTLFITARTGLYAIPVKVKGAGVANSK